MIPILFKIIPQGSHEHRAALDLRWEILRKPLGLIFSPEELEQTKDHIQFAGFKDNEIVATAVLVPEGSMCKMRQVAVKDTMQGLGIGSQLIDFCELHAAKKFQIIYCHARAHAVPFYTKKGYVPDGDFFEEVTIPHLKMSKTLFHKLSSDLR